MTSVVREADVEERPGADPLRPHPDLLVPSAPSSSSLRRGSTSTTLAHPLWTDHHDSTPLRFGSIQASALPASSSPHAAAFSAATHVASLHRAAEVARYQWCKDHDVDISTRGSPRTANLVAAEPPTSRSTGIGLIDVSDDGASSSETLSGGESTTTTTSTSTSSEGIDSYSFATGLETIAQSTRRSRPRNAVSSTGGLQADIESWSRMVYDLGCAAGVVDDDDDDDDTNAFLRSSSSSLSSSERPTPPPAYLFGYTHGVRLFPHPWYARRYSGPAGAWLRSELLRRARDQPYPPSTATTQTPASAMANEWRQSTAAASLDEGILPRPPQAMTASSSSSNNMLSFPSLDPQTRSGDTSTSAPRNVSEHSDSTHQQAPPAAVPATSSTSVAVPSSSAASSLIAPGLFNPWRSASLSPPSGDSSTVTSTSQLLANPPRPPRTFIPPAASNVDRSITPGVLALTAAARAAQQAPEVRALTAAARAAQGAVGSDRPAAAAPSATSRNDPLPDSAFQVPSTTPQSRIEAAQAVARLASAQRTAAAAAAQRREEARSSANTTRRTGDHQQEQRRREGHGMTYLRHLRSLDGIDSTPASSSSSPPEPPAVSSPSTTVEPFRVFPWYTPPALDLPAEEVSTSSSSRPARLADPDGDAQGADWYRGVRARQENAQEEAAALRGLQDPNGEAMALDEGDASEGGIRLPPPWRPRSSRPREADDEDVGGRQGAARRQRNRTALVLATEDYDDDDQAGGDGQAQRAGSTLNDGSIGDEVATAGGWTLINPSHRNDEQQQPSSPVRETRDEGSENTTMWLRGPNSTSPTPMPSTTPASPPTSLRSLRRPRRLRSLASEDIIGAAGSTSSGSNNNDSIAASSASLPTMSVQDAPPIRRAEHHGRRGTGAADNVRSMTIDELRDREEHVHRLSLGGEAGVGQAPSHRASAAAASSSATAPAAAPSTSASPSSTPWLTRISQNIETELQQRHETLRASQQRLSEELTRRRRHLDELRQRQGRIGRVLERTAEMAGAAARGSDEPDEGGSAATASNAAAASLVRRRTLRDPAPAGLRAPRAVRLSQPAADPAPPPASSSSRLRRSISSTTLGEDKEMEEREASLASPSSSSSSPPRALDDLALSSSPTSRTSSGSGTRTAVARGGQPSPCLITPADQARLGVDGTRALRALDELGQRCGAYQEAALQAHRQRLLTWAPQQPALPTSAVPSSRHNVSNSSGGGDGPAAATSYPLRFEPSRQEPQPNGARSVLRPDQNGLRFNAAEGVDVVLRFLAAMPPSSSSSSSSVSQGADAYPTTRQAEDRLWAASRQRLLQRGAGTGVADAHEAQNERRRALGMAPRERGATSSTAAATSSRSTPLASINAGGPSGRTPWPQILARRPDLTAREYAVLSRFDMGTTSSSSADVAEDEQAAPIQQPLSRASSLSALRSLNSDDIDVLRALVLRTTRGPGGFAAATTTGASGGRGGGRRQVLDEHEEDSSDEETLVVYNAARSVSALPAAAHPAAATPATAPSSLPGPALPSLFPSRAIALSDEDVQDIHSIADALFPTTTAAGQASIAGDNRAVDDGHLIPRLASMDTAMSLIRRRANAIVQAAGSTSSTLEPTVADPLGPLFTLSGLSLTLTRRACAAATTTTTTTSGSSRLSQQQGEQPPLTVHALVFVSDEPITKEALRGWQGMTTAREVRQAVAASVGGGAAVGPGLAEEEEGDEQDEAALMQWDEEADLGDPQAMQRRAAASSSTRRATRQQGVTITTNDDNAHTPAQPPPLQPRAMCSFTFPGSTSSSRSAQMTMSTSQNINFNRTAAGNVVDDDARARRRGAALPIGRYLAVKLLPTVATGGEQEKEGGEEVPLELYYVGARGWPTAGMSSLDGGECL